MRSKEELLQLKTQAIALRRAGKSLREIKKVLGPVDNSTLSLALQGVPPPERTRRPRAKDAVRARARELREKGLDYEEIAAELDVSEELGLTLGQGHAHTPAPDPRGAPQALHQGGTPLLGGAAPTAGRRFEAGPSPSQPRRSAS